MLRFADGRPTQATALDDLSVEVAVVRDGHVGRASTNSAAPDPLRDCARRAEAAAEAAAAASRGGVHPGFAEGPANGGHEGHDPATGELDPSVGGGALSAVFAVADRHALSAHGIWSAAEQERAFATSSGAFRARPHHGRLHEGHLHRAGRPLRLRLPDRGGGRVARSRAARRARGRQGGGSRRAHRASSGRVSGRYGAARRRLAPRPARRHRPERARPRRGPRGADRTAGPLGHRAEHQPRRLSARDLHAAPRLRRGGRVEGPDAADPGRRGARRGPRPPQRGARRDRVVPATPPRPAATRRARGP